MGGLIESAGGNRPAGGVEQLPAARPPLLLTPSF